jgi:hypothetical protein
VREKKSPGQQAGICLAFIAFKLIGTGGLKKLALFDMELHLAQTENS